MVENQIPKDLRKDYTIEEILSLEKQYIIPGVTHYYQEPILIVGGEGALVKDSSGKKFIDLFSGISLFCCQFTFSRIEDRFDR